MSSEDFKKQYMPYHQKLYRVAYRLVEDASDAEDIVQEAYIKLWNKRNELSHIDNKEAFCVTMIKNLCFDFFRSSKKQLTQTLDGMSVADIELQMPEQMDFKTELEQVKYLIEQLPEQEKKVLILKHYDEYSFEEIEEMTGLKSVHIRVLLSRARKRIRELYISCKA